MSASTPSAAQVAALINRAASGRLLPAEQRMLGDLLTQARASLAGQGAALTRARATLAATIAERDELRAELVQTETALNTRRQQLVEARAERDESRAKVDEMRSIVNEIALQRDELRQRLITLGRERDALRQQLAARDDQHAPATVDCPRCPAKAGRPCRAPSGQQVPYHSPRRIAAQQAAGVGQ